MADLLSKFLAGAADDVLNARWYDEAAEDDDREVSCRNCGAVVTEVKPADDPRYCGEDGCQPCCCTDGVFYGYSRRSPCPDCLWCLNHPDEARNL